MIVDYNRSNLYLNNEAMTFRDKMLLLPKSFGIPPENEIMEITRDFKYSSIFGVNNLIIEIIEIK